MRIDLILLSELEVENLTRLGLIKPVSKSQYKLKIIDRTYEVLAARKPTMMHQKRLDNYKVSEESIKEEFYLTSLAKSLIAACQ